MTEEEKKRKEKEAERLENMAETALFHGLQAKADFLWDKAQRIRAEIS